MTSIIITAVAMCAILALIVYIACADGDDDQSGGTGGSGGGVIDRGEFPREQVK